MKRVFFFGDSNAWGYIPGGGRQNPKDTYPLVAARICGAEALVDGLNGRATVRCHDTFPGELHGGASFLASLRQALPLTGLVICLGTNDVMGPLNLGADEICENLAFMFEGAERLCGNSLSMMLVSPPPIARAVVYSLIASYGGDEATILQNLAAPCEKLASRLGIHFFDGSSAVPEMTARDGFHLDKEGHRLLGEGLGNCLLKILQEA